ncbi:MAG: c-type cytochrome [Deltaproteobacteria bacterium]|jgi:cytochrome c oxidase cbb3-type subunit 3|nr:c-type cytochrome [Deltaproteobacteria bacterium]
MLDNHEHNHAVHEFDGIIENRVSSPPIYYTILFYGLVIWGVAFCAFYLLSGWSSEAEFQQKMMTYQETYQKASLSDPTSSTPKSAPPAEKAVAAVPAEPEEDGTTLYAEKCAMCHGENGKGSGIGPNLARPDYIYGKTPEAITESIAMGRSGGMPAFSDQLSDDEIQVLVNFLLSL